MQGLTDSAQHTTLSLLLVRVQKRGPLVSVRPGAPEMVVMVTCGVILYSLRHSTQRTVIYLSCISLMSKPL